MYNYKGQEKEKILEWKFKGIYGYVRGIRAYDHLFNILDKGFKISVKKDCVEFIHPNYP